MNVFDPKAFRSALGRFATGVTIITTRDETGAPIGVTANSFNSVSLDPPMVLWSLAKSSNSMPAFSTATHFAVHILAEGQEDLSSRFASRGADRFAGLELKDYGPPLLDDCAARFLCRTAFQYEGGDHVIFVGEVIKYEAADKAPLLFVGGRYSSARRPGQTANDVIDPGKSRVGQESLTHLIASAHTQIARQIRHHLIECDLQQPRFMIMIAVGQHDHPAWADVQARVAATGYATDDSDLAGLTALGWLSETGGRLSMTDAGRAHYFEALSRMKALEEHFSDGLTDSELAELRHSLNAIIDKTADEAPGTH